MRTAAVLALGVIGACSSSSSGRRDDAAVRPVPPPGPAQAAESAPPAASAPDLEEPPPRAPKALDPADVERAKTARTTAKPGALKTYAFVPHDKKYDMHDARGKVTGRAAAAPAENRVRWTLIVRDDAGRDHGYVIELPDGVAMPVALGSTVVVRGGHSGGGPNVIPRLLITDEQGGLLLAHNQLPEGWEADYGRRLSIERGDPYDELNHATRVRGKTGKPVELVPKWRAGTIDGVRFYGHASAVKRKMKSRKQMRPPDYVGGWIDYTLLKVD